MRRNIFYLASIFGLLLALGLVAQAQIGSPRLGYVFDGNAATGGLRPLVGFPGAAYIGAPLRSALKAAYSSPDGQWHLVVPAPVVAEGEPAASIRTSAQLVSTGDPGTTILELTEVDQVVWAENSRGFAIYSSSPFRLRRYELNASNEWIMSPHDEIAERSGGGRFRLLAYDPARSALWYSLSAAAPAQAEGDSTVPAGTASLGLSRLDLGTGTSEMVFAGSSLEVFSLPANKSDLAAAGDVATGKIYWLESVSGVWQHRELPTGPLSDFKLTALRILNENAVLSAWTKAPSSEGTISEAKLLRYAQSGDIEVLDLESPAEQLGSIPGTQLFQMQAVLRPGSMIWFYDASTRSVLFVPDAPDRNSIAGIVSGGELR